MPSLEHDTLAELFPPQVLGPEQVPLVTDPVEAASTPRAGGEAKGEAKAVLRVLAARGIEVPDDAQERIWACTDLDQLDVWITRAATARTIGDLFDEATD